MSLPPTTITQDKKPIDDATVGARADSASVERLAVPIPAAMKMLGVGRSTIYGLMSQNKVVARKIGRRTVVTTSSIRAFLEALPAADIAAPKRAA